MAIDLPPVWSRFRPRLRLRRDGIQKYIISNVKLFATRRAWVIAVFIRALGLKKWTEYN
ncbi:hypothetical protein D1AOALGA4SA_9440 [Olavius algarvensis Delta 1 endosymbiont]|nr:hypothetical protein D1AOALGA4SA_9440 [Olavius algarvensis Delta 1 endosymbiont]